MKTVFEQYGSILVAAAGTFGMFGIYRVLFFTPDGLLATFIRMIGSGGLLK